MEYLVDRHRRNTSKVIWKPCKRCGVRIVEGDVVVTKPKGRVYHKFCWDAMHIDSNRASSKKWRKNNPEEYRRMQNDWRKRNPEKVRAARRKHYREHRQEEKAARKRRYQLHPFKTWTPEEKKKHYAAVIRNRRKRRMELAKK
jgi:hypothetical protein